jgi:hypothetical protein
MDNPPDAGHHAAFHPVELERIVETAKGYIEKEEDKKDRKQASSPTKPSVWNGSLKLGYEHSADSSRRSTAHFMPPKSTEYLPLRAIKFPAARKADVHYTICRPALAAFANCVMDCPMKSSIWLVSPGKTPIQKTWFMTKSVLIKVPTTRWG